MRGGVATLAARPRASSLALAAWLALLASPVSGQRAGGTVSGRVLSAETGQPIDAAHVYLVGTGLGTLTTQAGRFVLVNVPPGTYVLRAERIGMRAAEQRVMVEPGQSTAVELRLATEALGLDEIVVTGTAGAARRREVGNSVAAIDVSRVTEPPVSVDALLQARAAGLTVLQSSGSMGSGAMIRLRGNKSVAMSNQPIVYVDGVRLRSDGYAKNVPPVGYQGRSNNDIASPLNDINPNDIERIEIIKGAAATTLYGTEAAAGVIQIFTRRGHRGQPRWTFQIDQGFSHVLRFGPDPSRRPPSDSLLTAAGGRSDYMFINPWLRNAVPLLGGPDCPVRGEVPAGTVQYCKEVPNRQRYALSVSGGGEALGYFVSASWEDNEGVLPNDREKKGSLRGNFTFTPLRSLQVQWNTAYATTRLDHTAAGNNAHGLTLNAFRRDRNYARSETRQAIDPLLNQELTTHIDHLVTGVTATWNPRPRLTSRLTAGWDLSQVDLRNLRPYGFPLAPTGIISDRRFRYQNLTLDYVGTADVPLSPALRAKGWPRGLAAEVKRRTGDRGRKPGPTHFHGIRRS